MEIKTLLFQEIRKRGYISISEFMEIALTLFPSSYYRFKNPFSDQGDFITSPEVSQMFGEMVGIWVYNQWQLLGKPSPVNLVELGPGQGLLMRDLIKVILKTEMKAALAAVYFYDVNEILIEKQKQNLSFFDNTKWTSDLNKLPNIPCIFIANEFFDALPINQYVKEKETWRQVILKDNPEGTNIIFEKITVNDNLNEFFNSNYKNAKDGAVIEESTHAAEYIKFLSRHSLDYQSASLIIDYGYDIEPAIRKETQFYSTLQAIKEHKYSPLLEEIGRADISAHVDFQFLKQQIEYHKAKVEGAITQRDFLLMLGIEIRCQKLIEFNPSMRKILTAQLERLVSKKGMGELFKLICITHPRNNQFIFE